MNLQDLKLTYIEFRHVSVYGIIRMLVIKFGRELILEAVQAAHIELTTNFDGEYKE